MVRFKNRYLLVELIDPSFLVPKITHNPKQPSDTDLHPPDKRARPNELDGNHNGDDEEVSLWTPAIPFIGLPEAAGKYGDDGGGAIYRAVKSGVVDVFGDEGWGRVGSSFRGGLAFFSSQSGRARAQDLSDGGEALVFSIYRYQGKGAARASKILIPDIHPASA